MAPLAALVALEVDSRPRLAPTGSLAVACGLAGPDGDQELLEVVVVIILSPELSLEFSVPHFQKDLNDDLVILPGEAALSLLEAILLAARFATVKIAQEGLTSYPGLKVGDGFIFSLLQPLEEIYLH